MKKTICVVTGSRAEYGLLRPLLCRLKDDDSLDLSLVVTGSHLNKALGNTQAEIEADGFTIKSRLEIPTQLETNADMAKATGVAMTLFADYFSENIPQLLVVLGDRYEIFAAATAAAMQGIPIAHIHGGETTEGAIDEFLRHAITKMSSLHFASCDAYRRRIIQLGEAPARVYNVGALGVENCLKVPLYSLGELQTSIGFTLEGGPYTVVTFHPATLEENTGDQQQLALIKAMDSFPGMKFLITKANADAGGSRINQVWEDHAKARTNWCLVASLGMRRYLSALQYAEMMLGNSSSGISEAPALRIPTVNIGNRQKGRVMAGSVISCTPDEADIVKAMKNALSTEFKETVKTVENPFGDGSTSEKILQVIKQFVVCESLTTMKSFYDIEVED